MEEKLCPLCGEPNGCMTDGIDGNPCWCFTTKVPEELRLEVPADKKGGCICRKCIEEFKKRDR